MEDDILREKVRNLKLGESIQDGNVWFYNRFTKITLQEAETQIRNAGVNATKSKCPICSQETVHTDESAGSRDTYDTYICLNCNLSILDKGSY